MNAITIAVLLLFIIIIIIVCSVILTNVMHSSISMVYQQYLRHNQYFSGQHSVKL